jgi:hypothetical protein
MSNKIILTFRGDCRSHYFKDLRAIMPKPIIIRVFIGGRAGQSRHYFTNAIGQIQSTYEEVQVEILDTDLMKKDPYRFTPKEFVDWLIGGDYNRAFRLIFLEGL